MQKNDLGLIKMLLDGYTLPDSTEGGETEGSSTSISWVFSGLSDSLQSVIDILSINLFSSISAGFLALCTLSVTLYGYGILNSWVDSSSKSITKNSAKLFAIMLVFYNWGFMLSLFIEIFFDFPAWLINEVFTSLTLTSAGSIQLLDSALNSSFRNFFIAGFESSVFEPASLMSLFGATMILLAVGYMVLYAVYLLFKSFIVMAVLLSLGQLFVPLLLFKFTRSFAENWIKQMSSYALVPFLTLFMIGLIYSIGASQFEALDEAINGSSGTVEVANMVSVIFISILGALMMKEIPDVARGIGNGFVLSGGSGIVGNSLRAGRFLKSLIPTFNKNDGSINKG